MHYVVQMGAAFPFFCTLCSRAQDGSKLNFYVVTLEVQISEVCCWPTLLVQNLPMTEQLMTLHLAFTIQSCYCNRAGNGLSLCFWEYRLLYQEILSFKDFCFLLLPNPSCGGELIIPFPAVPSTELLFIYRLSTNNEATQLHSQDIYYPHKPLIKMQPYSVL